MIPLCLIHFANIEIQPKIPKQMKQKIPFNFIKLKSHALIISTTSIPQSFNIYTPEKK